MNGNIESMHLGARQLERVAFEDEPGCVEIGPVLEHLKSCSVCMGRVEILRAERDAFITRVPPNVFLASLRENANPRKTRPSLWGRFNVLTRPVLAGAAAIVLLGLVAVFIIFRNAAEATEGEAYPEISLKGQAAEAVGLSLYVSRDGTDAVPWVKNEPLHPGELIKFGVRPQKSGYVTIVNLDDRGSVSIYYPTKHGASARIVDGKTTVLPGSIVLDDFIGEELLIAFVTPQPGDVKRLGDMVRSVYKRSANGLRGLLFGDRNADVGTLKIRKVKP